MKASCRVQRIPSLVSWSRTRCPIQDPRNRDGSIGPNLIGFRFDLFEHVEVVFMPGGSHALEDADITAGKVRHAQAKHRFESVGTHHRSIPRMGCAPVVTHDDGAGNIQCIEQSRPDRQPYAAACTRLSRMELSCARIRAYLEQSRESRLTQRLSFVGAMYMRCPESRDRRERRALPKLSDVQGDAIRRDLALLEFHLPSTFMIKDGPRGGVRKGES